MVIDFLSYLAICLIRSFPLWTIFPYDLLFLLTICSIQPFVPLCFFYDFTFYPVRSFISYKLSSLLSPTCPLIPLDSLSQLIYCPFNLLSYYSFWQSVSFDRTNTIRYLNDLIFCHIRSFVPFELTSLQFDVAFNIDTTWSVVSREFLCPTRISVPFNFRFHSSFCPFDLLSFLMFCPLQSHSSFCRTWSFVLLDQMSHFTSCPT